MPEPIRTGMVGFVGCHKSTATCLLFNFIYYPEGKTFESRPKIQDIHEFLGVDRFESRTHMPEAAITKRACEFFPYSSLRFYVNVEEVDGADLGPSAKAHYRDLSCPLMTWAKTLAETPLGQYPRLRDRKNHFWKVAEAALEENLEACTNVVNSAENDRMRVAVVDIENDIPLPPSFFPRPRP